MLYYTLKYNTLKNYYSLKNIILFKIIPLCLFVFRHPKMMMADVILGPLSIIFQKYWDSLIF